MLIIFYVLSHNSHFLIVAPNAAIIPSQYNSCTVPPGGGAAITGSYSKTRFSHWGAETRKSPHSAAFHRRQVTRVGFCCLCKGHEGHWSLSYLPDVTGWSSSTHLTCFTSICVFLSVLHYVYKPCVLYILLYKTYKSLCGEFKLYSTWFVLV